MRELAHAFLERRGVDNPRLEGDLLVSHALGCDRLHLMMRLESPVLADEVDRARDLLVRRGRREPLAYITGTQEFYSRPFLVGPGCLIPRPESELLVDLAKDESKLRDLGRVCDLGTGSGVLAVTLALEEIGKSVIGVDVDGAALDHAKRNAQALGAPVELVHQDGLAFLAGTEPFDLIVSNPPYVDPKVAGELEPEVREYEPAGALFAPEGDPDHWVRELCKWSGANALAPGGLLLVELGFDQGPRALALAEEAGFEARICPDLAGLDRVLWARRKG
jgi:release factor glutamine methyltransferase